MGVRMGPRAKPRGRPTVEPDAPTTRAAPHTQAAPSASPWLRRVDLLILPLVFAFDILVFSQLLRSDGVTGSARIAIVGYSAIGVSC